MKRVAKALKQVYTAGESTATATGSNLITHIGFTFEVGQDSERERERKR